MRRGYKSDEQSTMRSRPPDPRTSVRIFITTVSPPSTMPSTGSIYDPPIFGDDISAGGEPVGGTLILSSYLN